MKLTREQIDFLCPEHVRSSCNDENQNNRFYSSVERRLPRCTRCFLLWCLTTNYWEDKYIQITPNAQLSFKPLPCEKCHGKGVY